MRRLDRRPLDRRITLHVEAEGTRDRGEFVPGAVVDYELWASRETIGADDERSDGVARTETVARFILRWNEVFASTPPNRLGITDALGRAYNVRSVADSDERRRFVEIEAISVT